MTLEILLKNGIFVTLFLSMLSFWGENLFPEHSTNQSQESWLGATIRQITARPNTDQASANASQSSEVTAQKTLTSSSDFAPFQFSESFFLLSFFFITFELLFRWFVSGHPPLSNLYESLLFFIWGLIGFFLFLERGLRGNTSHEATVLTGLDPERVRSPGVGLDLRTFLGGILSSAALFMETFADWRLPSEMKEMKPLIPALQSNWLLMHVSIMILSYAALLIGCLLAISYIALTFNRADLTDSISLDMEGLKTSKLLEGSEEGLDRIEPGRFAGTFGQVSQILSRPDLRSGSLFLSDLDSLSFRILAFGFPLLTLGILSGAVWANEAWGSYWSWDPKETWAFITWLIFAFYLHTRLQYGWEGKKSASVATFGFFILWICYLGVNLLGKGLHSYGWLS